MRNKRKIVVAALVALLVLGGVGFAFQANSERVWTVRGDDLIGMPVSDSEAAKLVGGCGYWSYENCGKSSDGCTKKGYFACILICYPNEHYIDTSGPNPCGGSCSEMNVFSANCAS